MLAFPEIFLRLCLSLFLGALIGLERESKYHAAGIRTHALISLGSALFTIISTYGFLDLLQRYHLSLDPTRIASYVLAGIGFLGGGVIFTQRSTEKQERVKGLTTDAAIWVVAAIGMACGLGLYWIAVVTTVLALFILYILHAMENKILPQSEHPRDLLLSLTHMSGTMLGQVYEICREGGLSIERVHIESTPEGDQVKLIYHQQSGVDMVSIVNQLKAIEGVQKIEGVWSLARGTHLSSDDE